MEERIECKQLLNRVATAKEAATLIQNGMTVAVGGYTSSGYPKVIAQELVQRKRNGEPLQIRLLSGANDGPLDTLFAEEEMLSWRAPMIESKVLAKQVNAGKVHYVEQKMNKMPQLIQDGVFGKINVAVVEALRITKEGHLIPTSSIGMNSHLLEEADAIIVEINTAQPITLDGMHDVFLPGSPPNRQAIPLTAVDQKIGLPYVKVDRNKIRYIVHSDVLDTPAPLGESKEQNKQIAANLLQFLTTEEMSKKPLPPFQTGFGNLVHEIVTAMSQSQLNDITFFCGGLQEAHMELIAAGRVKAASTGSIQMTPRVITLLEENPELFRKKVIIRNGDITNHGEPISRLGLICLNSGLEMDIYGNVNSSHISGTKVLNGIGGGANFAENAGLSIFLIGAESKGGKISNIVPFVTHQDISEHDIDVVITENGVADLRGKDDIQRAREIIAHCASPNYKDALTDYLDRAISECGGHHPHLLAEAFLWHIRLKEIGTMQDSI